MHTGFLFTCPSGLPDFVRSVAVSWLDRVPKDRCQPTLLLYAPTLCPTPEQEMKQKNKMMQFSGSYSMSSRNKLIQCNAKLLILLLMDYKIQCQVIERLVSNWRFSLLFAQLSVMWCEVLCEHTLNQCSLSCAMRTMSCYRKIYTKIRHWSPLLLYKELFDFLVGAQLTYPGWVFP